MKVRTHVPTLAELNAQELAAKTALDNIAAQRKAAIDAQNNQVRAALDNLPQTLGAITGRKLGIQDAFAMLRDHVKGKLTLSAGDGTRAFRGPLSDDERTRLRTLLTNRQAVIDSGGRPEQTISQISRQFKTTDATVNKWKAEWGLTRPLARKSAA